MAAGFRPLLILTLAYLANVSLPLQGRMIRVCQYGKCEEKSIKSAVDKAVDGDTVWVGGGFYFEKNIEIRQAITLISDENAVLDGEKKYEIISVKVPGVRISGFCFQNTGASSIEEMAAVHLYNTSDAVVEDNRIENAFFGILLEGSRNCTVLKNKISGTPVDENITGNGIHMWKCDSIRVSGNLIQGHRDGIYLEFVTNSEIHHNFSHSNLRYGLHFMFSHSDVYEHNEFADNGAGVAVMFSRDVSMNHNIFRDNWGNAAFGLLLKEINGGHINFNYFENNTCASYFEGATRMSVHGNTFRQNGWAMKIQASCDNVKIDSNNFLLNTFDVATNGSLVLNDFNYNYWDKYEGYDLKHDGIGDVHYQPVSLYSMITERNPGSLLLLRSFLTTMLDRAEKVMPSITPEKLRDEHPLMKPLPL